MKKLKKLIRTLHLWLGLTSGVVVVIVGLTGAALVFEEEGRELAQHHYYYVNPGADRLPLQQMVDTFKSHYPKEKILSIRFKESRDAAMVVFTRGRLISM